MNESICSVFVEWFVFDISCKRPLLNIAVCDFVCVRPVVYSLVVHSAHAVRLISERNKSVGRCPHSSTVVYSVNVAASQVMIL